MYQSFLLFIAAGVGASTCLAADFSTVSAAEGHFEYTKDGAGTLGFISASVGKDKVKFTTCNDKTVEVMRTDLQPSTAECDARGRAPGGTFWPVGLISVYKSTDEASNTVVNIEGKDVDLKQIGGWPAAGLSIRNDPPGEPVGYVFTDSNGSKAIAILEDEPPNAEEKLQSGKRELHLRETPSGGRSEGD